MKQFFFWCYVVVVISSGSQKILAMDPTRYIKKKFRGHELTALAIIDRTVEKKGSISYKTGKRPIALFNYDTQEVIVYVDRKNNCTVSYETFKQLMVEQWRSSIARVHKNETTENKHKADTNILEFLDRSVCCIS